MYNHKKQAKYSTRNHSSQSDGWSIKPYFLSLGKSTYYIPIIIILLLTAIVFNLSALDIFKSDHHQVTTSSNSITTNRHNDAKVRFQFHVMMTYKNMTDDIPLASNRIYHNYLPSYLKWKTFASDVVSQPVYISMTTIHSRIYGVASTIHSILDNDFLPDHIFIYVSSDPYLLDQGMTLDSIFTYAPNLKQVIEIFPFISIVFTTNLGPHRKLLPLLSQKYYEDCVIITIDDHEVYHPSAISSLINTYTYTNRQSVIALRARRIAICSHGPPYSVTSYANSDGRGLWPESLPYRHEMLLLPTGMGGVLYRPSFFHPIVFDHKLVQLTHTADDIMFRLCTLVNGISIVTACAPEKYSCKPESAWDKISTLKYHHPVDVIQDTSKTPYLSSDVINKIIKKENIHKRMMSSDSNDSSPDSSTTLLTLKNKKSSVFPYGFMSDSTDTTSTLDSYKHTLKPYHLNQCMYTPKLQSSVEVLPSQLVVSEWNSSPPPPPTSTTTTASTTTISGDSNDNNDRTTESSSNKEEEKEGRSIKRVLKRKLSQMLSWLPMNTLYMEYYNILNILPLTAMKKMMMMSISFLFSPITTHKSIQRRIRRLGNTEKQQLRQEDSRKKVSLASIYNLNHSVGNSMIWTQGIQYLYTHNLLDFNKFLDIYMLYERQSCMYSTHLITPNYQNKQVNLPGTVQNNISSAVYSSESRSSILYTMKEYIHQLSVTIQSLYDKECGINYCAPENVS